MSRFAIILKNCLLTSVIVFYSRLVQSIPQPSAILDLHFHPDSEKHGILAVVSSTGTLSFFKFEPALAGPDNYLTELSCHRPLGDDESVLLLSCCWHPNIPELIAITASNYEVHVLRVGEGWNVENTTHSAALSHTLEAWTVAFSPTLLETDVPGRLGKKGEVFNIFSGGDDSKLFQMSCLYYSEEDRPDEALIETNFPIISAGGHQAGVTAILPLAIKLDGLAESTILVLTGSYDDHIRAFAVYEAGLPPRLMAEEDLGGGVWRLKLIRLTRGDPENWSAMVLASCMHAGSRILKVTGDRSGNCKIQVVGTFEEHKSMNYGSDFQPGSDLDGRPLKCISTSFYDKLLCLWEFP